MKLESLELLKILKLTFCSAVFSSFSFIGFSFALNMIKPEFEILKVFYKAQALDSWLRHNVYASDSLFLNIIFLIVLFISSYLGVFSVFFAKAYADKTVELMKSKIL